MSRYRPSVSASRCHLPIAARQGGVLSNRLPGLRPVGEEAFDALFGQDMLEQPLDHRQGRSHHVGTDLRSEEHTSELQSLMRISYAVFCLNKQTNHNNTTHNMSDASR